MIKIGIKLENLKNRGVISKHIEFADFSSLFEHLKGLCAKTPITTDKDGLLWFTPSYFNSSMRRGLSCFGGTSLLALDIDEVSQEELDNFIGYISETLKVGFFVYETPTSMPDHIKLRVVFELSEEIKDPSQFKKVLQHYFSKKINYDRACAEVSRFFYIPNSTKLESFIFIEGEKLEVNIPTQKKEDKKKDLTPSSELGIPSPTEEESFFFESPQVVANKLARVLKYLKDSKKTITKTHRDWVNVCFACVSLQRNQLTREDCFNYFVQFSELDGKDCAPIEELTKKFDWCWKNSLNKVSVRTIYGLALNAGLKSLNVSDEAVFILRMPQKNTYYLVIDNKTEDDVITLHDEAFNSLEVLRSYIKIQPKDEDKFVLKKADISRVVEDEETGQKRKVYRSTLSDFQARYAITPKKVVYLLGGESEGSFYEKSTKTLLISNHHRRPCKAVFHDDIDDWISQLNIDKNWFYTYLYYLPKVNVATPLLHCWGETKGGKSVLATLIGSIWSSEPIKDYFDPDNPSFKDTAGSSPVIWFDEEVPEKPNAIKNLVTSYEIPIKQKFEKALYTRGYSRIISAVNDDTLKFTSFSQKDDGALLRRIQPIHFTKENRQYLKNLGGKRVTSRWIQNDFREHVKFIEENPQNFNLIGDSDDIIALEPCFSKEAEEKNFTFNEKKQAIQEYFFDEFLKPKIEVGKSEVTCNVMDFLDKVLESKLVKIRPSRRSMENIIKSAMGKDAEGCFRTDMNRGKRRWRINVDTVYKVLRNFGLTSKDNDIE